MPLVLIGDENEPCVDPAVFRKREIPTAGLVVIPQSGHAIRGPELRRHSGQGAQAAITALAISVASGPDSRGLTMGSASPARR